ncbi:MAG: M28 family metallopeptidase [Defluviitaleaceae bacterium]|nr:M28 family metallopeptidase [Defluviitaleaceae bacterium]
MKESIIFISATALLAIAVFFVGAFMRPEAVAPDTRVGVDISAVHGEPSVRIIEFMSENLYDRFPYSYQEKSAALWIYDELAALGFDDIRMQEFTFRGGAGLRIVPMMIPLSALNASPFANLGFRADRISQNVILTMPGQSSQTIIIGAHYDSIFVPGASDNASGTALLIESAARMRELGHYYTLQYVFFGAEEVGLYGAWYFANSIDHDDVLFMINADVLLEGPYLFYMAGYDTGVLDCTDERWGEIVQGFYGLADNFIPGSNHITETWDRIAREVSDEHGFELFAEPLGAFGPSDHLAFLPFGHTVMFMNAIEKTDEWHARSENMTWWEFIGIYGDMMRVVHTPEDCFVYIDETWPGKLEENMRGFMLFLEAILLEYYGGGA